MTDSKIPLGPRGSWVPTLQFIRNPRKKMEEWKRIYGDPFLIRALNGPIVMTGREDLIRAIYGANPDIYEPFAKETIAPILGGGSIFTMGGSAHRRERKLLMPMFHGDRMRSYLHSMIEATHASINRYLALGKVNQLELATEISFAIIVRSIFGESDSQEVQSLVVASKQLINRFNPILFFTRKSHRRFFGMSPWDRMQRAKSNLDERLLRILDERKKIPSSTEDILSLLRSAKYEDSEPISEEHILNELRTFLFAGHETTALTLTWAMYHLHRNPDILDRLREELDSFDLGNVEELQNASYLKACVQETLRVHPIVTETLRLLNQPFDLGEYSLPAGFIVSPVTVLAHYNPDTFSDPERFSPERFLERTYSPFQYMPFGGGHRRCLGAAFATFEMAAVLGTLLKNYRFELMEQEEVVPVRRNVTMGPSSNVPTLVYVRTT